MEVDNKLSESYNSIVQFIKADSNRRKDSKELFTFILKCYCSELEKNRQFSVILECFETALEFYGKDSLLLIDLGTFFAKFDRDEEAKEIFTQAYQNDVKNLRAYQCLENVKSKIARWHFIMLNDERRNQAFNKAIRYWIETEGKDEVLDIGTGTGLLSLYASSCDSVKRICAVESSSTMCGIASKVLNDNGQEKITLINKNSTDLELKTDIESKFNLIVTEILDCGIFGEGILESLIHAKEFLLEKDGRIVPHKVIVHVAGFSSKSISTNHILLNETFNEYIYLGNYRLIGENVEPYDAEYVDKIDDFRIITNVCATLEVNFNSIKSLYQHHDGIIMKNIQLQSNVSNNDFLDGFVVWFDLHLNEMDPSNVISSKPSSVSCWNQAIFKLRERVVVQKYEIIKLTISCRNGVLKIDHEIDEHLDTVNYEVDNYVIKFLNDEDYLENLEYAANEYKGKIKNLLDLSPFPYIGFLLIKESRVEFLWCSKKHEDLLKILAEKNCINEKLIIFIDESDISEISDARFELIILNPFNEVGDLNSEICCNYELYQKLLSDESSLLIPHKISLFGQLVNSNWLVKSTRVQNDNLKKFKIDKYMNEYSTQLFLDISNLTEYEKLTDEFRIATISLTDQYHEKTVSPFMRNINLPCHAVVLFFKIQLTSRFNREFATFRRGKYSCFRKFAHVFNEDITIKNAHAKVTYRQNYGIIKIECE